MRRRMKWQQKAAKNTTKLPKIMQQISTKIWQKKNRPNESTQPEAFCVGLKRSKKGSPTSARIHSYSESITRTVTEPLLTGFWSEPKVMDTFLVSQGSWSSEPEALCDYRLLWDGWWLQTQIWLAETSKSNKKHFFCCFCVTVFLRRIAAIFKDSQTKCLRRTFLNVLLRGHSKNTQHGNWGLWTFWLEALFLCECFWSVEKASAHLISL